MYQQITVIGNLGRDPKMALTPSGVPVTSFSVAVNRSWTTRDGQRQHKTTWFRVAAWQRLAEICSQYLSKGQRVLVVGEVEEPSTWTDQEGETRASIEVRARDVQFFNKQQESTHRRLDRNREHSDTQAGRANHISSKTVAADKNLPSDLDKLIDDYSDSNYSRYDETDWENDINSLAPEGAEWRDDDGEIRFPQ